MYKKTQINKLKSKKIIIFGKVQGVGYRKWLQLFCNKKKINGWVTNYKKSCVVAHVFAINEIQLKELITQCLIGPKHAIITNIDISDSSKIFQKAKFHIKNK